MIHHRVKKAGYFLYSRHFSDSVLITAAILIPSVFLAKHDLFETGTLVSLGAMCVGIADLQGPLSEKIRGMGACNFIIFIVALITGYAGISVYLESAEIMLLCFIFSMFSLYGSRATSIGTTALMVMIVMMYKHPAVGDIPFNAFLLLSGGLWYSMLSIIYYAIFPTRQLRQVIGECVLETSKSLRLKADLYDLQKSQNQSLQDLVLQQINITEKQEDVRKILYSSQWIKRRSMQSSKILTATFVDLMDVYEQIISTSYYETIREKFNETGVVQIIEELLEKMADNLAIIGNTVQSNGRPGLLIDLTADFIRLKKAIDEISATSTAGTFILKKSIITWRTLDQRIRTMHAYFVNPDAPVTEHSLSFRYHLFLIPQTYGLKVFIENLNFESSTFRYAIRVALVAFVGFVLASFLLHGGHSYWILFTTVFIMKPAFSLSKQRNYQRIIGTLGGGLISFPIMMFVQHNYVIFILLMISMVVAYSFMRINYTVFVIFMTTYVLLMFKLLGTSGLNIVGERVIDTLIGAALTFVSIYFIFPNWEFKQVRRYIGEMARANLSYLSVLKRFFSGDDITINDYKLARKETYSAFANLAASFQRMMSEPVSKQRNLSEIQNFVILNHQLASMIGSNAAATFTGKLDLFRHAEGNLRYMTEACAITKETINLIQASLTKVDMTIRTVPTKVIEDDAPVKSQLKLIRDKCAEIREATEKIFVSRW